MIRGGHANLKQFWERCSENGDIANWKIPKVMVKRNGRRNGSFSSKTSLDIHQQKRRIKILKRCSLPPQDLICVKKLLLI
jgi:acyl CoA:acetate/3-ketoacid CoA transferase beta subunit